MPRPDRRLLRLVRADAVVRAAEVDPAPDPGVAGSGAPALSTSSSVSVQVTVTVSGLPLRWNRDTE